MSRLQFHLDACLGLQAHHDKALEKAEFQEE